MWGPRTQLVSQHLDSGTPGGRHQRSADAETASFGPGSGWDQRGHRRPALEPGSARQTRILGTGATSDRTEDCGVSVWGQDRGRGRATGRRRIGKERETQAGAGWALGPGAPVLLTSADQVGRRTWGCNVRAGLRQARRAHRQRGLGLGDRPQSQSLCPGAFHGSLPLAALAPGPPCHQTERTWSWGGDAGQRSPCRARGDGGRLEAEPRGLSRAVYASLMGTSRV